MYQTERQTIHELPEEEGASGPTLDLGVRICVRNRFLGDWTGGYQVAEVCHDGYRIRRISDGLVFPDVFPCEDVRQDRRAAMRGTYLDRRL